MAGTYVVDDGQGGLFIGIPADSATERMLTARTSAAAAKARTGFADPRVAGILGTRTAGLLASPLGVPGYKTGTEVDILSKLQTTSPQQLKDLQVGLYAAGMLKEFTPGELDKKTKAAFLQLLGMANASGVTWGAMLDRIIDAGGMVGKEDEANKLPAINITNPDDLKAILKGVSQTLYGGNLPDTDVERFVQSFQAQQVAAGQAQNAASEAGTGAVFTEAPQADVAAETQIRAEHPNEVFANALNNRLNTLGNALLGGMIPSGMR